MRQYALGSMGIGMVSSLLGIVPFKLTARPAGPLIVLVSAAVCLVTLLRVRRSRA